MKEGEYHPEREGKKGTRFIKTKAAAITAAFVNSGFWAVIYLK